MRFLLLALAAGLLGCVNLSGYDPITGLPANGARVEAPSETPDIRGTLKQLTSGTDGGTLLIEREAASTTGVERASVRLTSQTLLIRPDGQRMSFRELAAGQTVEAWFQGPVAESDPVQATARAIRRVN